MTTKQLFLVACELCPMEQNEFLLHLSGAVRTLLSRYPTSLLCRAGDAEIKSPASLEEECGIDDLYSGALLQGVIAAKTKSEADRRMFLEEAEHTYRTLWRRAARGARHVGR